MSLLRENNPSTPADSVECQCQQTESTGVFGLKIEPKTVDVREKPAANGLQQAVRSEQLQDLFFPNMNNVAVHQHPDGFHVHPQHSSKVGHISQLHDMLDEHDLVARVQITPSAEHPAMAVALSRDHINTLVSSGTVDLKVPMHNNTFRLHSTTPGRITAIEYV